MHRMHRLPKRNRFRALVPTVMMLLLIMVPIAIAAEALTEEEQTAAAIDAEVAPTNVGGQRVDPELTAAGDEIQVSGTLTDTTISEDPDEGITMGNGVSSTTVTPLNAGSDAEKSGDKVVYASEQASIHKRLSSRPPPA